MYECFITFVLQVKKSLQQAILVFYEIYNRNNTNQMPKHQGPIQKLIDPFSIPAQMNNLGVLIVAHVAVKLSNQTNCCNAYEQNYLMFIYYGSTVVCLSTFLISILYMLGAIDYCFNKIMPCGEVCLTLNTLIVFLVGTIYHFVATIYGIVQIFRGLKSDCVEIQMFKEVTCTIYLIWFFCIVLYLIGNWWYKQKNNKLNTVEEQLMDI